MTPRLRPSHLLIAALFLFYPALVFYALQNHSARVVALAIIVVCAARYWLTPDAQRGQRPWLLLAAVVAAGISLVSNSVIGVKSYPVMMNAAALAVFAYSLKHPPTIIERFARARHPDLGPQGVRYTRKVTIAWCLFFAGNGLVSALTVTQSERLWALYNGVIAYLAMASLFAIEWLLRPRH